MCNEKCISPFKNLDLMDFEHNILHIPKLLLNIIMTIFPHLDSQESSIVDSFASCLFVVRSFHILSASSHCVFSIHCLVWYTPFQNSETLLLKTGYIKYKLVVERNIQLVIISSLGRERQIWYFGTLKLSWHRVLMATNSSIYALCRNTVIENCFHESGIEHGAWQTEHQFFIRTLWVLQKPFNDIRRSLMKFDTLSTSFFSNNKYQWLTLLSRGQYYVMI